jgi:hypothetical protein
MLHFPCKIMKVAFSDKHDLNDVIKVMKSEIPC